MSYQLPVEDILRSAWAKIYGTKQTIWIAFIIALTIVFYLSIIQSIAEIASPILANLIKFITIVISYFLQIGLLYIGICRAKDLPIHYQQMFRAFSLRRAPCVIGIYLVKIILLIIPNFITIAGLLIMSASLPATSLIGILVFCLGLITTLYLLTRLILSPAIVLDQDLGPIQAIKLSFKLTHSNVLRLLSILLIQIATLIICVIPLGIGLIWWLPFLFITYGTIYKNLLQRQTA